MTTKESLQYYTEQSDISDPKEYGYLFEKLPKSISELCKIVHGVITHRDSSELYDLELTDQRKNEPETRYVNLILKRIKELDNRSLIETRTPDKRFTGTCRDFAILLCSILRYQGTPARIRCGYGAYFRKNKYEDHWVCEYWNDLENRWILADAEVDEIYKDYFKISFDVTDIPRDQFLVGGQAWIVCRSGKLDADNFGLSRIGLHGIGEVRGNVCRDIASLNHLELLPWDDWELSNKEFVNLTEEEIALISKIAELTLPEVDNYDAYRNLYQNEELLVPKIIISHTAFKGEQIIKMCK